MLARPVILGSVMLIDPVDPSTCSSAPCQASRPARVTTNEGTPKRLKTRTLEEADRGADQHAGGDRQVGVPAVLDVEHGHHRGGEAADGADREVDLAEQQHVDDADRDQPDGGDLQHQVGQVLGREEAVVLELEDRPDHRQADDDAQRGEVALDETAQGLAAGSSSPSRRSEPPWRLSTLITRRLSVRQPPSR